MDAPFDTVQEECNEKPVTDTIDRQMERFAEIAFALFCLALVHWGFSAAAKRIRRGVGNLTSAAVRPSLHRTLTAYYRRKVTKAVPEQRRKDGVPPLENPRLD